MRKPRSRLHLRRPPGLVAGLVAVPLLFAAPHVLRAQGGGWQEAPRLPFPVANNAVVGIELPTGSYVFSFMGLDETRAWDGVVDWTFGWSLAEQEWTVRAPVPGPGRLAATAEAVAGRIVLFGGYTVAEDGAEKSVPNVDLYDPLTDTWSAGSPIPVPVDDAVSGVWRDSLVYLVSGWHDDGNESLVQVYDVARDRWTQATPIPGVPVFGHAGSVARDQIVYVDGVRTRNEDELGDGGARYRLEPSAWRGRIDPARPTMIDWQPLPAHPGPGLYRAASGPVGTRILFVGGTINPYNYDGVGYDGAPSEPVVAAFLYDVATGSWSNTPPPPVATMDHRNLVRAGGWMVLVGGMEAGQRVTDRVMRIAVLDLLGG